MKVSMYSKLQLRTLSNNLCTLLCINHILINPVLVLNRQLGKTNDMIDTWPSLDYKFSAPERIALQVELP
jgi:hypothetical protein